MEYYSPMERNEILPFVEMWMDLGNIIHSEVSQRKTNTTHALLNPKFCVLLFVPQFKMATHATKKIPWLHGKASWESKLLARSILIARRFD